MSLTHHYWMRDTHRCSGPPVSKMTYTVSSGTLNSSIPWMPLRMIDTLTVSECDDSNANAEGAVGWEKIGLLKSSVQLKVETFLYVFDCDNIKPEPRIRGFAFVKPWTWIWAKCPCLEILAATGGGNWAQVRYLNSRCNALMFFFRHNWHTINDGDDDDALIRVVNC